MKEGESMDLKRCSTGTTMKEGESSKKLMEVSPAMSKRKAELDPVEEESESDSEEEKAFATKAYMTRCKLKNGEYVYTDSSSDPDHNLIKPEWWKAPEWGVDSFDELEYDSAKEANNFSDDETQQSWYRFKRQLIQNKGFYVDQDLWSFYRCLRLIPVYDMEDDAGHDQTFRQYYTEMAQ